MKSNLSSPGPGLRLMQVALLALGGLLPHSGHAQDGSRPVSCRLLCMEGAPPPAAMLCQGVKGVEVACEAPANTPSPAIVCYAVRNQLKFSSRADHQPVATATIPATAKSVILLFIPSTQAPPALPWRVYVIDDTPKNFPDGGAFVANFYSQNIRFIIGEHKIILKPASSHGLAMPKQRDDFNMAAVAFEFQQEKRWRSVSESLLRFLPDMRYLVIAYVDPASGRPRLFVSTDVKAAPAAPAPD
ncbi:MAG: hypothetical protein K9N23_18205 [Akkermansiaceae bacterium]|nr:hypothetical protein [Akkermansiaceae bacterium]